MQNPVPCKRIASETRIREAKFSVIQIRQLILPDRSRPSCTCTHPDLYLHRFCFEFVPLSQTMNTFSLWTKHVPADFAHGLSSRTFLQMSASCSAAKRSPMKQLIFAQFFDWNCHGKFKLQCWRICDTRLRKVFYTRIRVKLVMRNWTQLNR